MMSPSAVHRTGNCWPVAICRLPAQMRTAMDAAMPKTSVQRTNENPLPGMGLGR